MDRDEIALEAMKVYITIDARNNAARQPEMIAYMSYQLADAMIAQSLRNSNRIEPVTVRTTRRNNNRNTTPVTQVVQTQEELIAAMDREIIQQLEEENGFVGDTTTPIYGTDGEPIAPFEVETPPL